MLAMNEAFKSAAALGISVFCAAGDDGANDNVYDGHATCGFFLLPVHTQLLVVAHRLR